MKQIYLTVFALLFVGSLFAQPPMFVKHDATGANDGSSWDNAYTDLQSALDNPGSADIWIAEGTYVPGAGSMDTMSTFSVMRPVNIIGGFAGTESSPDDRNPVDNETILSGDLAGNDSAGNREDNAIHVMVIDSAAVFVTLDALTISGGNSLAFNPDISIDQFLRRGAGIYTVAKVRVTNCDFTENYGGGGVGVSVRLSESSGSVFQNCNFYGNTALDQGVIYAFDTDDLEVKNCSFSDNQNNRGSLYPNSCNNVLVENCEFKNNFNPGGFGGAFFNWQCRNIDMINCQFINNSSTQAGAIYSDNRNLPFGEIDADNFLIKDCVFEDNSTTDGTGGAINAASSSIHLLNSTFTGNKANGSGGGVRVGNGPKDLVVTDCVFENNEATGWGAGLAIYGDTTNAIIKNTTFERNIAMESGGGMTMGFGAEVTIEDCELKSNGALTGGGVFSQNDYTSVTIKNSLFAANTGELSGGGLRNIGGQEINIESSNFEGNQAPIGAGINMGEDSLDLSLLNLTGVIFNFNIAETQGGALNIGNANSNVTNCLFVNNQAQDIGTGGAISTNGSGPNELNVTVVNSTFADNTGSLSGGIATWTTDTTSAKLFLQNNAFVNGLQPNYAVEAGNTLVQSLGGNFSDNNSTDGVLTDASDINNSTDAPMFVDLFNFDYHILASSPFVDKGVSGGPTVDLDGNPRDNAPDIGAYEAQSVDTDNIFEDDKNLTLTPNPVVYQTELTIENEWIGEIEAEILDVSGKKVKVFTLNKNVEQQSFSIRVDELQKGIHFLLLSQNGTALSKRLIKL